MKYFTVFTLVNMLMTLEYGERDLVLLRHQIGIDWKNGKKVEVPRTLISYTLIEYLVCMF